METLVERYLPISRWVGVLLLAAAELTNRVWVALVFWRSGMNKVTANEFTLDYLFSTQHPVPPLSPELAANLAMFGETVFPVLVILGLFGRWSAGALFLVNLVAYYGVVNGIALDASNWPNASLALHHHYLYGVMLLFAAYRGPGLFSVDGIVQALYRRRAAPAAD